MALNPEERSSAGELLHSPFIREAVQQGVIDEQDPRLAAFAASLENRSYDTAEETIEALASIIIEEWCVPA